MITDVNLVTNKEYNMYKVKPIKPDMNAGYNNPYRRKHIQPKACKRCGKTAGHCKHNVLERNGVDVYV